MFGARISCGSGDCSRVGRRSWRIRRVFPSLTLRSSSGRDGPEPLCVVSSDGAEESNHIGAVSERGMIGAVLSRFGAPPDIALAIVSDFVPVADVRRAAAAPVAKEQSRALPRAGRSLRLGEAMYRGRRCGRAGASTSCGKLKAQQGDRNGRGIVYG